jgi:transposase
MGKRFRAYNLDQQYLLPPDVRDWVAEGHLATFVNELVREMDLSAIIKPYDEGEQRGQPPYHPELMVKLLIYGYCTGRMSSRKLEQACSDDVAVRMLTCNQQPDHASIAEFRRRHLPALADLFVQVLLICEKAGLVKLGRVAIDGTKIKANAAQRHTYSYERLSKREQELDAEVKRLLGEAETVDQQEDEQYGVGQRGDELPEGLKQRSARLAKIKAAKADLEREAKEAEAEATRQKAEQKEGRAAGDEVIVHKCKPKWVKTPEGAIEPPPKRQRNLTDLDARLMKDTAVGKNIFIPGYNPQIAVDDEAQIIVATQVTQAGNDMDQLVPTLLLVKENLGRMPEQVLADSGYFSPAGIADERIKEVDLYVRPNKPPKQNRKPEPPPGMPPRKQRWRSKGALRNAAIRAAMTEKLDQPEAKAIYKKRSEIVEPPFATIKHVHGFRQFLLRGVTKVNGEWSLVCTAHNLLKLFRLKPEFILG